MMLRQERRRENRGFFSFFLHGTALLTLLLLASTVRAEETEAGEVEESDGTLLEALSEGKVHANLRFRMEIARQSGLDRSNSYTERLRVGYTTKPFHGFTGLFEVEDIRALREDLYNAAGQNGQGRRTVVGDVEDTEINQALIKYWREEIRTSFILGRQRIAFDDHRFIGDVGWRQNQQTFDAFHAQTEVVENVTASYAYLWDVNRIFGPDSGLDFESDSHLFNVAVDLPANIGKLSLFSYLLRFPNAKAQSSNTVGFRFAGKQPLGEDLGVQYEASYAKQKDGSSNPIDYRAHYYRLQGALTANDIGQVGIGYEELGSDDGNIGFATPLSTLHKFNGWADAFLVTPARGLEDLFIFIGADLPFKVKGRIIRHYFREEHGDDRLGAETDILLTRKVNDNTSLLAKFGILDGSKSQGQPDTFRFTLDFTLMF